MMRPPQLPKIGIYGGSFDPIHRQHIHIAECAYGALGLNHLLIVPTGDAWQKKGQQTAAEHRLRMLEIALRDHPQWEISTIEIERHGPTYSIDTIQHVQAQHKAEWYLIIGADQWQQFHQWKNWQTIAASVHLAVVERPDQAFEPPQEVLDYFNSISATVRWVPIHIQDTSSSQIRTALRENAQECPLDLDPIVYNYILQHQLYMEKNYD